MCLILPFFIDMAIKLDVIANVDNEVVFLCMKDAKVFGALLLAVHIWPFKDVRVKATLAVFAIQAGVALIVNMFGLSWFWSPITLAVLLPLLISLIVRATSMQEVKEVLPQEGEAYYVLVPVYSWVGIAQVFLCPWHPGMYESRIVVERNYAWLVHHHKYKRVRLNTVDIHKHDHVKVSLKRPLHHEERLKLDRLVGQQVIFGIRDCRKLLVAGEPWKNKGEDYDNGRCT